MVARPKAWVYGRVLLGAAGSNPTGGMEYCVLSGRGIGDRLIALPEEFYQVQCV
jgi:hypothetical protein